MGGLLTTKTCKSCGWSGCKGTYAPEFVVFVIGLIVFAMLYPRIDWNAVTSGDPGIPDVLMLIAFAVFVVILPIAEIARTVIYNRGGSKPLPDKCPVCGGSDFETGGGFH
jgi:hypothetical protein